MKIFVTVGTTAFNQLIKQVDLDLSEQFEVVSQISTGSYIPQKHQYFGFSDDVEAYYNNADLIITHGGAGSIFKLLQLKKKILIVPNLDRVDNHQIEICNYMLEHNHALGCIKLSNLLKIVKSAATFNPSCYTPEPFTGISYMREYFGLKNKTKKSLDS